jgi:hypothetical protein
LLVLQYPMWWHLPPAEGMVRPSPFLRRSLHEPEALREWSLRRQTGNAFRHRRHQSRDLHARRTQRRH